MSWYFYVDLYVQLRTVTLAGDLPLQPSPGPPRRHLVFFRPHLLISSISEYKYKLTMNYHCSSVCHITIGYSFRPKLTMTYH
jgi:hypothetical protein